MVLYIIVVCSKCGRLLLAKKEYKTRTCPYCGFKGYLDKLKKVATAENADDALTILHKLKRKT